VAVGGRRHDGDAAAPRHGSPLSEPSGSTTSSSTSTREPAFLIDASSLRRRRPGGETAVSEGGFCTRPGSTAEARQGMARRDFEIVNHEAPRTGKAAKSSREGRRRLWIRLDLRESGGLGDAVEVSIKHHIAGTDWLVVELRQRKTCKSGSSDQRVARPLGGVQQDRLRRFRRRCALSPRESARPRPRVRRRILAPSTPPSGRATRWSVPSSTSCRSCAAAARRPASPPRDVML